MTNDPLSLKFLREHPRESARALEKFEAQDLAIYLENIPDSDTAKIIRYFTPAYSVLCLSNMETEKVSGLLEKLGVEFTVRIMRRMQYSQRTDLLRNMPTLFANMVRLVLKYPKGTVGQYISPDVFVVSREMDTGQVLNAIRKSPDQLQNDIYVVNEKQQLIGVVDAKLILTTELETTISVIMKKPDVVFNARVNLSHVRDHGKWLHKEALPVIEHSGVFVGVLKRAIMLDALKSGQEFHNENDTVSGTLLEMAELFWETCANLLIPETDSKKQRR